MATLLLGGCLAKNWGPPLMVSEQQVALALGRVGGRRRCSIVRRVTGADFPRIAEVVRLAAEKTLGAGFNHPGLRP